MKHKLLTILMCLCIFVSLPLPVLAVSQFPMVIDNADLLSADEETALEEKARTLRTDYEMDVVILTVQSLDGKTARAYADDYYDENGYGYDEEFSGILFLLAMDEREWYISTCGKAIYAFTDYGLDTLGEQTVPYLSDGDYFEGFDVYLDSLPYYFTRYEQEQPVDGYVEPYEPSASDVVVHYKPKSKTVGITVFFTSLFCGILTAGITIFIMRGSMNTKRKQSGAGNYLKSGSYYLRTNRDMFLYSHVSKVRRQENNGGHTGGHHGGGSRTHRSSSGRSHGGRGGRF